MSSNYYYSAWLIKPVLLVAIVIKLNDILTIDLFNWDSLIYSDCVDDRSLLAIVSRHYQLLIDRTYNPMTRTILLVYYSNGCISNYLTLQAIYCVFYCIIYYDSSVNPCNIVAILWTKIQPAWPMCSLAIIVDNVNSNYEANDQWRS